MILLLLTLSAMATEKVMVSFSGEPMEFQLTEGALLNAAHSQKESIAKKALRTAKLKKIEPQDMPSNPDSVLCEDLGGRALIGKLESKDEKGFCRFKDGSIIDNEGLWLAASKRAKKN